MHYAIQKRPGANNDSFGTEMLTICEDYPSDRPILNPNPFDRAFINNIWIQLPQSPLCDNWVEASAYLASR